MFLKNVTNFTGRHLCWSLFLIKLQTWKTAFKRFEMIWSAQTEICDIFKSNYFEEHLRTTVPWNQFHKLVVILSILNSHCEFFYPNKEKKQTRKGGLMRRLHCQMYFTFSLTLLAPQHIQFTTHYFDFESLYGTLLYGNRCRSNDPPNINKKYAENEC